jgi:hypothetical protein
MKFNVPFALHSKTDCIYNHAVQIQHVDRIAGRSDCLCRFMFQITSKKSGGPMRIILFALIRLTQGIKEAAQLKSITSCLLLKEELGRRR